MSGMAYLTGYLGEEPMLQSGLSYGDPLSGMNAAFGVVSALLRRRHAGEGMHIELSQTEGLVAFNADSVLDYTMNGRVRERMGNRDRSMSPHGVYRCLGTDKWVALAVPSDAAWERFCGAMGNPDWCRETRFADAVSRYQNQDEMDKLIEAWTITHTHYDVMRILQAAGVPAGPILDAEELLAEPHLNSRGYYEVMPHKVAGSFREIGPFALFSRTPLHIRLPAPSFGEHNQYVLGQLLGMTTDEIAALTQENIIGDKPLEKQQGSM